MFESGIKFIYATNHPERPLKPEETYVEITDVEITENRRLRRMATFTATSTSDSTAKPQSTISLPLLLGEITINDTRVAFIIYRKISLFLSTSLNKVNEGNVKFIRIPNTPIISATVYGVDTNNLTEPVNSSFAPTRTSDNKVKTTVNYWHDAFRNIVRKHFCGIFIPVILWSLNACVNMTMQSF